MTGGVQPHTVILDMNQEIQLDIARTMARCGSLLTRLGAGSEPRSGALRRTWAARGQRAELGLWRGRAMREAR